MPEQSDSPPGSDQPGEERRTPRFDAYTGKPLADDAAAAEQSPRFDPYTGQAIGAEVLPSTPPQRTPRKLWPLLLVGGIVIVAAGIGLFTLLRSGGKAILHRAGHSMTITVDLSNPPDQSIDKFSSGCNVADTGNDDLSAGAPVAVMNASGTVLASTFLPSGTTVGTTCHFEVRVHVPDSSFYQVEVSHRGTITFTKQDLVTNNWVAALSIGSP
jgi:hypothetical protein